MSNNNFSTNMGYSRKINSSDSVSTSRVSPSSWNFDTDIENYTKTNVNTSNEGITEDDGSINLNMFIEAEDIGTVGTATITDSLGLELADITEKPWYEKVSEVAGKVGATVAVATTSVLSGVLDIGEAILDGGAWVAAKVVGIISEEGANAIEEFIARDLVSEANEAFYENTEIGRTLNEASYMKYDSEAAQGIRSVSEDVGVFAIATALTVCTGGAAAPLTIGLGAAYGIGGAAEDTYATVGTNTSAIQELLILGNGALSALSWYTSGKLGKGFIEIGKSMAEAGVKEILAEMCRGIFSKEMLKELFKPSNIVGNAIGTLMQAGGDIGRIATKLYNGGEVTAEEWALLVGELIVYFGLNIAEDALRTEITDFKAPSNKIEADVEVTNHQNDLDDTLEIPKTTSDLEDTLKIIKITVMDLDESVSEDLVKFSRKHSIPLDYYYTDEGRKMLDIYEKLKDISFEEFDSRFTGLFSDEERYFEALEAIKNTKNRCNIITILNNEEIKSIEQFRDIQEIVLNRTSYSSMSSEMFENFRNVVETKGYNVDAWYIPIYDQLCKRMDLSTVDETIRKRLSDFTGGYVSNEKTQSIIGSFEFEVDSDFRLRAKDELVAGFNDGEKSVINLKYTVLEIEDIMNHESVHQISHNREINFDSTTGERISLSGVSRAVYNRQKDKWEKTREGLNESITEYFNIISHGEGYKKSFTSGYQAGVDALGTFVDNGLISLDDLKKFYFSNDGDGLVKYFDNISKKYHLSINGADLVEAFDQAALSHGNTSKGVRVLNKYLKEYLVALSGENKGTSIFDKLKGIFGY